MSLPELVALSTVACLLYLGLVYLSYALLVTYSVLDNAIRDRDSRSESVDSLASSPFTIPVSVLVPIHNEADVIANVIDALRRLEYPELELIVVDDGSTDESFAVLERVLDLAPAAHFERRILDSEPVRQTFRSRTDDRVLVIRKANGGKADALNCALNHARYRYVCCVDGDTIYASNALLSNMRLVMRDPKRVVGVSGHIAVATQPERHVEQEPGLVQIESRLLINFQHMEYLRSFLNNRLAWSRLNFMLCASGAFAIWRRDLVVGLGGFDRRFTCEDIEFTFRAHEHLRRTGADYRILSTPEIVGRTEGPATPRALVRQRERWQRVTVETFWHYRRAFLNPRYGAVGMIGMPFYLVTEIAAPAVEVVAAATLVAGIWVHLFDWRLYLVFLATIAFANALLTAAAVLMEDVTARAYHLRDLVRVILLSPLELVLYRPICTWARFLGIWRFCRGDRSWNKFERNLRPNEG